MKRRRALEILGGAAGLPLVAPASYDIGDEVKDILSPTFVHNHKVIPLDLFGGLLIVATYGDLNLEAISEIEQESGRDVNFVLSLRSDIERAIETLYPMESLGQEVASRLDELFGS